MDAIEKRARELISRVVSEHGSACAPDDVEVSGPFYQAVAAALTPPEGYVLVSQTQLSRLLRDVVTAADFVGGRGQSKPLARRLADQAWALIESPGDAARPEVPGA